MPKQKPTGFIARCPWCGVITGAMDYTRTDRKEAGTMLGKWLMTGHVVEPRFHGNWSVELKACQCNETANAELSGPRPPAAEGSRSNDGLEPGGTK